MKQNRQVNIFTIFLIKKCVWKNNFQKHVSPHVFFNRLPTNALKISPSKPTKYVQEEKGSYKFDVYVFFFYVCSRVTFLLIQISG